MEELMKQRIWILWRKEANGDRITKVPFAASGGATGTNEKYRHTWVTYDEAVEAAKKVGAAGVGFVIPEGYFFLDIDHADLNDPRVKTMLSRFDSYAEFSVSGNGVHCYGKVDMKKLPISLDKNGKPRMDKQFYLKNPHTQTKPKPAPGTTGRISSGCSPTAVPGKSTTSSPSLSPGSPGTP